MVDPDDILARYGLGPERDPMPVAAMPLAAAEHCRERLLRQLDLASASIGILRSLVVHSPDAAAAIDAQSRDVMVTLNAAGEAMAGMQAAMTCRGEA